MKEGVKPRREKKEELIELRGGACINTEGEKGDPLLFIVDRADAQTTAGKEGRKE